MIEELLDEILSTSLHNAQSSTWSVLIKVVVQVQLDWTRKKPLEWHWTLIQRKYLILMQLRIGFWTACWSTFMAPISTSVSIKKHIATELKKFTNEFILKFILKDPIDAVDTYSDVTKSTLSCSESEREKWPHRKSSNHCWKRRWVWTPVFSSYFNSVRKLCTNRCCFQSKYVSEVWADHSS